MRAVRIFELTGKVVDGLVGLTLPENLGRLLLDI